MPGRNANCRELSPWPKARDPLSIQQTNRAQKSQARPNSDDQAVQLQPSAWYILGWVMPLRADEKSRSPRETTSRSCQQLPMAFPILPRTRKPINLDGATIRLAGDSGDGMQLLGTQLTNTSALLGNDVATFPDFPAEIRAPRGTRAGVSGFQVQILLARYLHARRSPGRPGGDESRGAGHQYRRSGAGRHPDRERKQL